MTLIDLYNRTYNNCVFYKNEGKDAALLNEIGVLRGIMYCLNEIVGEDRVNIGVNSIEFAEMIADQQRLKEELSKA